jgi:hypothetical protein
MDKHKTGFDDLSHKILVKKTEWNRSFGRPSRKLRLYYKLFKDYGGRTLTDTRGSEKQLAMASCKDGKESSGNVKCRGFLD